MMAIRHCGGGAAIKKAFFRCGLFPHAALHLCVGPRQTYRYMWIAIVVAGVWSGFYALSLLRGDEPDEGGNV